MQGRALVQDLERDENLSLTGTRELREFTHGPRSNQREWVVGGDQAGIREASAPPPLLAPSSLL